MPLAACTCRIRLTMVGAKHGLQGLRADHTTTQTLVCCPMWICDGGTNNPCPERHWNINMIHNQGSQLLWLFGNATCTILLYGASASQANLDQNRRQRIDSICTKSDPSPQCSATHFELMQRKAPRLMCGAPHRSVTLAAKSAAVTATAARAFATASAAAVPRLNLATAASGTVAVPVAPATAHPHGQCLRDSCACFQQLLPCGMVTVRQLSICRSHLFHPAAQHPLQTHVHRSQGSRHSCW